MLKTQASLLLATATLLGFSCSPADSGGPAASSGGNTPTNTGGSPPASGGLSGTGGLSATGGLSSTGGLSATGGLAGSGGLLGSGGTLSTGGGLATTGGTSTGGVAGSGGGSAGAVAGSGTAGAAGSGSGGSSSAGTPTPSPGCSKGAGRPANGTVTVTDTYYLAFPASYNGTTPMPVIMGFHGCGSGNRGTDINSAEWTRLFKGTGFETDYIRAVAVSQDSGGCFSYSADMPRATKMYDDLVANYCVDTSRVFATGHSSGAQFVVQQMLAKKADFDHFKLKGVAPVAADPATLAGPMPVMYIDGKNDNQRSATSATNTVKAFRTANTCSDTSKAYAPVMTCKSSEGPDVDPGCIIYDNCKVPTIWCSHNDPSYSGTQHGVPCFALKGMYDFFKTL